MATQNVYSGDGTANQVFNLTFEYLDDSDIRVEIKDTTSDAVAVQITKDATNGWELINPTSIKLKGTLQPASTDNVRIYRETDISSKAVTYAAGSAIRAQDLNKANDQVIFSVEEWRDQRVPLYNAVLPDDVNMGGNQIVNLGAANSDDDAVNREQLGNLIANDLSDDTAQGLQINKSTGGSNSGDLATVTILDSSKTQKGSVTINEGEGIDVTYTNGDAVISGENSSKSNKGVVSINEAHGIGVTYTNGDAVISADKSTASQQGVIQITPATDPQGNPIQFVRPADGELTLGIPDNSIDLSKLKNVDVVTQAEQNADPDNVRTDDDLFTAQAATTRFDTIVSLADQLGTDYPIGKTWLKPDDDLQVKIWDGNAWQAVASGGDFIQLTKVIYVDSTNGNDSKTGHRISGPKLTIKEALSDIAADPNGAGTTIILAPGVYREELPLTIPKDDVSIIGQGLRSCFVQPASDSYAEETMFLCRSGTLLQNITFVGMKASGTPGDSANNNPDPGPYGLPPNQGWCAGFVSGCVIRKSPYIQNCTSFNDSDIDNSQDYDPQDYTNSGGLGGDTDSDPTGGGILCDGSVPAANSPLRSFVVDSFTQVNLNGPGILCTNNAYAQLVSFFGTFCRYHAKALNGGQLNLSNCTTDFGTYGLIADGKSTSAVITGQVVGSYAAGSPNNDPNTKVVLTVDNLASQGNFQTNQPGPTQLVTIGSQTYMILQATPVSNNTCDITLLNPNTNQRNLDDGLIDAINDNDAVSFYLQSYISTGGHTFEYVGSGTNYSAHPDFGGQADSANQYKELGGTGTNSTFNGGKVWLSATDEEGNFKVGDTFAVDQKTGFVTIDPSSVSTNVVSDLTPQLGGPLDLNNRNIEGTGNIDISGDIHLKDGDKIRLGSASGGDFQLYFSGSNTFFKQEVGDLKYELADQFIVQRDSDDAAIAKFNSGADVELYYDGNKKLETSSTGVTVTGTVDATSFTGDGSALTGIAVSPLSADLDVGGYDIISTSNGNIDLTANGTGLIRVTENNLSQVPIVTQHDIGTAANEIPLNQYLGTAAFQDSDNFSVGNLQVATAYTFATLPSSPSVGRVARVTDSTVTTWSTAITTGGGSNNVLCWYNGTNWTVIGV